MSYCVNCGVELDATAKECPLCNTPVMNPKAPQVVNAQPPFPQEKDDVKEIERADLGWLVSMVALSTAVTCGILNWLVFKQNLWSLAVIGACVIFWVFLVPVVIYHKFPPYLYILFDGATILLYLYFIARMIESYDWFWGLGMPIVLLLTLVVEVFALAVRLLPKSVLAKAFCFFTALALFCVGLELEMDRFMNKEYSLSWSAVVLTVCFIIDIALITTLSRRKLRNAVRRRLHF